VKRSAPSVSKHGFAPQASRARSLDQAIRDGLADSLATIFAALDAPRTPADPKLAALLARVRTAPVPPAIFGVYVELVLSILAEREAEVAAATSELLRPLPPLEAFRVCTLVDSALGAGHSARYRRLLAPDIACRIRPLAPRELAIAEGRLADALDLIATAAPDVFDEFNALVREVVLVRPVAAPAGQAFGAASTFSLWGSLVFNAEAMRDRVGIALQLAHEAGHALLFGMALGGRITRNDPGERHPSPLRSDERPMEGVAHATFVTGRMIYLLDRLLAAGVLTPGETREAHERLSNLVALEAAGRETVRERARLGPAGREAFADLDAFMAERGLAK